MAATNKDKNKALAALTSAALALPGLNAQAAIPSSSVKTNVSYGHYEESDNRMRVDVYHADAVLPITDRFELFFSLDRDTYSGATPAYSLPESMTKLPKYDYENPEEVSLVDITSAASSVVTPDLLTIFFLNQLKYLWDNQPYLHDNVLNELKDSAFVKPLLNNSEPSEQIAFLAEAALFESTGSQELNTLSSPSTNTRLLIDAIKIEIEDYVKATGDFETAFKSIIKSETDRNNAFNDFKQEVKNKPTISEYVEKLDIFNQTIEDEYQTELEKIETEYTSKTNDIEEQLAAIKQDYETGLEDIGIEFDDLKTLLDQQYYSDRLNLTSDLNDAETEYNLKIDQTNADLLDAEDLFKTESAALTIEYDNEKKQLEDEYTFEFNKLAEDILSTPEGRELADKFETNKTLLDTRLVDGKTALLTTFTSATATLNFGPTAGFATTNLSNNQSYLNTQYNSEVSKEQNAFNSGKSTLDNEYQTGLSQLEDKFSEDNSQLDTKFNADKALVETARIDAENQYITNNPRPANPVTIANSVTINFPSSIMNLSSYAGKANNPPISESGACAGSGFAGCYYEDDFVIGIVEDTSNTTAHLHRGSGTSLQDKAMEYHADSTGIYIRSQKGEAFSLDSMKFMAPITDANPNSGPNDNWEILGFSQAANPNLDQGDGTNYATRVAYQKIANGFNGTLNLSSINDDFKNINAVWIHYQGYPKTPKDGKEFDLKIDDIVLSPVVTPTKTQIAWDNALQLYKTNYLNNTYTPALTNLENSYNNDKADLETTKDASILNLTNQYNSDFAKLETAFNTQKNLLAQKLQSDLVNLTAETNKYNNGVTELTNNIDEAKTSLTQKYLEDLGELSAENGEKIKLLNAQFQQNIATLTQNFNKEDQALLDALTTKKNELQALAQQYQADYEAFITKTEKELSALDANYNQKSSSLSNDRSEKEAALLESKIKELEALTQSYLENTQALLAHTVPTNSDNKSAEIAITPNQAILAAAAEQANTSANASSIDEAIKSTNQQTGDALTNQKSKQENTASAAKDAKVQALADATKQTIGEYLAKQTTIALYRDMLDKMVPTGDPAVQRFMLQPQETRTMPQFSARYYWDATTLSVNGGLSDEPDFLSNFGSFNLSHEFNDKLTTVSAGYGMTSNQITRGTSHTGAGHDHDEPPAYPALNEESTSHNFNASLSQVLDKNTVYQFSTSFTHQSGYLSNPYKTVYIRGEVTAEEYWMMNESAKNDQPFDWRSISDLEMVSTELFREVRPDQRNMWSFSNRINHHIPALDASVHFDYRFYTDDWNINSHTFELKWYQNLPGGWTIIPGIRYYSQSQAEFFAPYFLAPRADGHYSSDFRLSAFGDLSGGVTVSKQFARGISLEAGIEYVTHSGDLKLGGGGVGDYADFDYYIAHANLNIDFGARPFTIGDHGGHHHHHHHGAPPPAGVMFGHMMNQADEIMIGYRYQYSVQSGSMLHGSDPASDAYLVANACTGNPNGCLYKPTKMHMQMHMLDLMYAPTDWLNIMVMPQLMSMDMTMSQALRDVAVGEEDHGGTMHTSNDLGDTVATALVKLHDDGTHHVHVGIGMSAPTGSIDAQISQGQLTDTSGTERKPGSAVLQDYGMQLGSGTWDFKPSLTYSGHADDWGWGMQFSGIKRLNKNKYGYAYGDLFQATGWGSYQIMDWLSATVRGVYTWQDKIHGESTANHENTSPVDFTHNYGGRFVDVGLGLNVTIPDGKFAGNSISVEWLQPVATDFNGTQLDRDGALAVSWSFSF